MSKKRFIAGAVCPRCGKMDKLKVDMQDQRRECVACGYADALPDDAAAAAVPVEELKTRVTRARARRADSEAQAVHIVDLKKDDN